MVHTAADERALGARSSAATAVDAANAAAAVQGGPQDVGSWGALQNWQVVGVHEALLPNGKVLAYDSINDQATEKSPIQTSTRAMVWDPATGSQTRVDLGASNSPLNIFCSGLAHLWDGRIFVAGGNKDDVLHGLDTTHVFDPNTNTWTRTADMVSERWYPTVTPLADKEMLITSGQFGGATDTPEVRKVDGSLRSLTGASIGIALYPWMDVAPDGKTFNSGPEQELRSLDTAGNGAWDNQGSRDAIDRTYGSHALYDIGKLLVAGGGDSTATARTIDLNGTAPVNTPTGSMAFGRRQHNLTVLADGSVLATGGNSSGANLVDKNAGVYNAELWNSATGQWRTLAAESRTRQYHSTALLLPDGRVLSAGGGVCGVCDTVGYLEKNAQVFTPPYLYNADGSPATRPVIDAAPGTVAYGGNFTVATPDAASIAKVALVRLGAVTHSNNMEQRYVPLAFSAGAGTLNATGPATANVAPPGVYMLFVVDDNGVPSVSRMVTVDGTGSGNNPPTVGLTSPPDGQGYSAPATVGIAANAADSDGGVTKVEFYRGATKLGEDTSPPYSYSWNGVAAGSYTLKAVATDDDGATSTSATRTITVAPATDIKPTVALTAPADGAGFTAPASVGLAATAADGDGSVSKVEFFSGASLIGTDTSAPYTFSWANVPAGTYTLTARATDNLGATTTSAPRTIGVSAPAGPPSDPGPGPGPNPPGPGSPPPGGKPKAAVVLRDLAVVGKTPKARRLRVTASGSTRVRLTLAKRRGDRWVALHGTRSAALAAGRDSVSLRDPWGGRRLSSGRYRVAVRYGKGLAHTSFSVK